MNIYYYLKSDIPDWQQRAKVARIIALNSASPTWSDAVWKVVAKVIDIIWDCFSQETIDVPATDSIKHYMQLAHPCPPLFRHFPKPGTKDEIDMVHACYGYVIKAALKCTHPDPYLYAVELIPQERRPIGEHSLIFSADLALSILTKTYCRSDELNTDSPFIQQMAWRLYAETELPCMPALLHDMVLILAGEIRATFPEKEDTSSHKAFVKQMCSDAIDAIYAMEGGVDSVSMGKKLRTYLEAHPEKAFATFIQQAIIDAVIAKKTDALIGAEG